MEQQQQQAEQQPQPEQEAAPAFTAPFDPVEALVWIDLAKVYPASTMPVATGELRHLCASYLQARADLLKARTQTRSLTTQLKLVVDAATQQHEELAALKVDAGDMRAALPTDWEPARVRNQRDYEAKVAAEAAQEPAQAPD